jgi:putative transposase
MVFHVLNRAVGRRTLFRTDDDYRAFERVLSETLALRPMRICAYCLMPNHWHLLLWPERDGQLSAFLQHLTNTHVKRWKAHRHEVGHGHLYQGRFKSFPLEEDQHFYTVARYVERNAARAGLVRRAEAWPWGSLFRWLRGSAEDKALLSAWPLPRKSGWVDHVNRPLTEAELAAVRKSVQRGTPFGSGDWSQRTVRRLGLESTLRPRGRPKSTT